MMNKTPIRSKLKDCIISVFVSINDELGLGVRGACRHWPSYPTVDVLHVDRWVGSMVFKDLHREIHTMFL